MKRVNTDELAILIRRIKVDSLAFTDSTFQQSGIGGKAMDTFARLVTRLAIGSSKSKSSLQACFSRSAVTLAANCNNRCI